MSLKNYNKKRDFSRTSEPAGKRKTKHSKSLEFVVQKHDASHLHYDFRLELDGVLKSWAVPKGPSLRPEDKRLAMMVEDHPFSYRTFEGVITKGNYGAGNVIVWDRGAYEPREEDKTDPEKVLRTGLKKGHLTFILNGQKLKGEFALIKSDHMDENAWLLVKKDDEYAKDIDITKQDESVLSGRGVDAISQPVEVISAPKSKHPGRIKPMLATLVDKAFDDEQWLFEIKWDGYRAIASWDGKKADLYSRNGIDFSSKYNVIYNELKKFNSKIVIDGEIVAVDDKGKSHFEWLQNYGRSAEGELVYYAFDLLWCDGHDLRDQPLEQRKSILKEILPSSGFIRYSDHIHGQGKDFFRSAEHEKLEGIMAKHAESTYKDGYRSKQWLKVKTHPRQEVVIGGFTEPKGSRKYIGALVVGIYEKNKLRYVGHVGGGIPPTQLASLRQKLEQMKRSTSPFSSKIKPNSPVHWVSPKLLCEVSFAEWTKDGQMRQPIFVGMRSDKKPSSISREQPKNLKKLTTQSNKAYKSRVNFTHLDKVFWPEKGYTKGDLIHYYENIMDTIFPYLKDRPQSLLRHPSGYKGSSFFQKDMGDTAPDWAKTVSVYSESNDKNIEYLVCDKPDTLLYMIQLGCIEINPWSSRLKNLHKPDWIVIDLDPEDVPFHKVAELARHVKDVCDELDIPTYPKTSGKTGIHVFIPTGAKYTYDQIKNFAEILANLVHERAKEYTSVERNPAKRRRKIYIDFLQNREGQTLAAPYCVRPTPVASVSTPLHWDEVSNKLNPTLFTIKNFDKRLKSVGDLWKPVLEKGIDIKKVLGRMS